MKLTMEELANSANNLNTGEEGPFSRFRKIAKPARTAVRMQEIGRRFNEHFKNFMADRQEFVVQFGTLNEDETEYSFEGEAQGQFNAAMKHLLGKVIDIPGARIKLFSSEMLSSTVVCEEDLDRLEWLIDNGATERVDPVEMEPEAEAEADEVPVAGAHEDEDLLDLGQDEPVSAAQTA
jgi:hypothetical protein